MKHRPVEPERSVLASILGVLNMLGDVVAMRNNTGAYRKGKHYIQYGLGGKGGADIIAFVHVRRGNTAFSVVVAIETKRHGKTATPEQEAWRDRMQRYGVLYGVCTTVHEALALVAEARSRARAAA